MYPVGVSPPAAGAQAYPGPGLSLRTSSPADTRGRGGGDAASQANPGPTASQPSRHPTKPTEFPGRGGSAAFGGPRPGRGVVDGRPTPGNALPPMVGTPLGCGLGPRATSRSQSRRTPTSRIPGSADEQPTESPCHLPGTPPPGRRALPVQGSSVGAHRPLPSLPPRREGLGGGLLRV